MTEALTDTAKVYGVTELTKDVKRLLEFSFKGVCVHGEISEYSPNRSGHVYLSIKDQFSQLRVVYFRALDICQSMGLGVGSEVEVFGSITVYEAAGSYQLRAEWIRPVGLGALRQQFEAMKERLRAEGLFDQERKRSIPAFPKCVGLITSPDGAAIRDFLNVLGRRHSGMHVRVIPVPVQGKDAAGRIANAVRYVNEQHLCDVIVLTRGGGSLEDLWPFNEEVLARAIAASEIPVISAVGHERDFSISDFVADFRCATPSVAAEQVVAAKQQLTDFLVSCNQRMRGAVQCRLADLKRRYEVASGSAMLKHPEDFLNQRRQHVDMLNQRFIMAFPRRVENGRYVTKMLAERLKASLPRQLEWRRSRLSEASSRLTARMPYLTADSHHRIELLNAELRSIGRQLCLRPSERLEKARKLLNALGPGKVLERGYSILLDGNSHAVRSCDEVHPGSRLNAVLGRGRINVEVVE